MADVQNGTPLDGGSDPRLEIPAELRRPVKKPEMLKEYEERDRKARQPFGQSESAKQASGWAIAMGFVWTVAAAGLIGWGIQWFWKAAAPWPLVVGLILGVVVGMVRFIRDGLRANK